MHHAAINRERLVRRMAAATELLVTFGISWAVVLAACGDWLGLGKELGGLIAGVSLASTSYRDALAARLAQHQAQGFQLLELQENRNGTLRNLEKTLNDLDRRMASAGGRGLRFGENLLARPAIAGTEGVRQERFLSERRSAMPGAARGSLPGG